MRVTTATVETPARPEWFASWFDSAHYHRLYANRDQAEAGAFVDRLIGRLHPDRGAAMLDLGCGSGRHSRRWRRADFTSPASICRRAASRARASSHADPPVYVEQDMREPFGIARFDFVFSLFTSFGYFEDRGDHCAWCSNIAQVTAATAARWCSIISTSIMRAESASRTRSIERDEVRYHLTRWSDADAHLQAHRHQRSQRSSTPLEYVERVAKLTLKDFQRLFAACGLVDRRGVRRLPAR